MAVETPSLAATIRVLNPARGSGFAGVTVRSSEGEAVTDSSGRATVNIPAGAYEIELIAPGARTHRVFGVAEQDFEQITYLSPDNITTFVFSSLGLAADSASGILVVGLDTPSLAPAVGASADIDAPSDNPFVFVGASAAPGSTIVANAQGFVTFPNVEPGDVSISPSFDAGACLVFPSETSDRQVTVRANEVSVIAFTCRTNP